MEFVKVIVWCVGQAMVDVANTWCPTRNRQRALSLDRTEDGDWSLV